MKRFLLALCLTLVSGMLAPVTPIFAQGMGTATHNVTGDWKATVTGARLINGVLHLTQVGDTVVGSAVSATGPGTLQIDGKFNGNKISGNWRGPTGEVGWITLNFQSDSTFSGEWGYGGRKAGGSIVAQKLRSSSF